MPIYEYHCEKCGAPFEVFVRSISKPVNATCPECGSAEVRKGISAFASQGAGAAAISAASSANCGPSF